MTPFHIQELTGKFIVKSDTEVLAVMDSKAAAEEACRQLNYEPGRNACDVFHAWPLVEGGEGKECGGVIPFTCAYWDYLRCVRIVEPQASEFGLSEAMADVLRRQCRIEFKSIERRKG